MGQGGARRESEDRITGRKQCLRQERSGSFSDFGSRSIACLPRELNRKRPRRAISAPAAPRPPISGTPTSSRSIRRSRTSPSPTRRSSAASSCSNSSRFPGNMPANTVTPVTFPRPVNAVDDAVLDRLVAAGEDDWNRRGRWREALKDGLVGSLRSKALALND